MLEMKNVFAGYGKTQVLKNLSLSLEKGEFMAVVGPNGCGKSTLLKTALGICPAEGSITVGGEPITVQKRTRIAQRLSYLSQTRQVPQMTVESLVLCGRYPHLDYPRRYGVRDREIAEAAIAQMGLSHVASQPLYALSGGMRQKAYLAMTLAQHTEGILLDEPTSALDVGSALSLMSTLRSLTREGRAVMAVLHDLPLAFRFADRVAVMKEGSVIACAAPKELLGTGAIKDAFGVTIDYREDAGYFYRYPNE